MMHLINSGNYSGMIIVLPPGVRQPSEGDVEVGFSVTTPHTMSVVWNLEITSTIHTSGNVNLCYIHRIVKHPDIVLVVIKEMLNSTLAACVASNEQ